jgi:hypothetical protein
MHTGNSIYTQHQAPVGRAKRGGRLEVKEGEFLFPQLSELSSVLVCSPKAVNLTKR